MLTSYVKRRVDENGTQKDLTWLTGLSSDMSDLPVTVANGSRFYAMDTNKTYWFNSTGSWIEQGAKYLTALAMGTAPTKTSYYDGDEVDLTGIVATATYSDTTTTTLDADDVSCEESVVSMGMTKLHIYFIGNGIKKTVEHTISVTAVIPASLAVTTAPTKTAYTTGETFDPEGTVLTVTYNNSDTAEVDNYTFAPNTALATTDDEITFTYTEGETSVTATQEITVTDPETDTTE